MTTLILQQKDILCTFLFLPASTKSLPSATASTPSGITYHSIHDQRLITLCTSNLRDRRRRVEGRTADGQLRSEVTKHHPTRFTLCHGPWGRTHRNGQRRHSHLDLTALRLVYLLWPATLQLETERQTLVVQTQPRMTTTTTTTTTTITTIYHHCPCPN